MRSLTLRFSTNLLDSFEYKTLQNKKGKMVSLCSEIYWQNRTYKKIVYFAV